MSLRVLSIVEQRHRAVLEVRSGRMSVRRAAATFGVSKTQLYEWLGRFDVDGLAGLVPRSRRPQSSPLQTSAEVEETIVALHGKRHGRWGAKKIRAALVADGWACPAVSTVQQILLRRGLITPQRPPNRPDPGRRFERSHCNDLWQIDGTQHRLRNRREFWVVDIIDDHSRFLLASLVGPTLTGVLGWETVRAATATYGLPRQLLSDNGTVFTGRLHLLQVRFEVAVRRAGIELIHSRIYHPQTLGKDERQHRTQNEWIEDHRPVSLTQAQQVLDAYRADYNTVRPHEALGQICPAARYQPGIPVLLPGLDELDPADDYPDGCLIRKVNNKGQFRYAGQLFNLPTRWMHVPVGLVRSRARLHVYYGAARIETFLVGDLPHPHNYRGNQ
jgi:transposase InsO family protein